MEWGLRKVLPNLSPEKKAAFAKHIVPVILETCWPEIDEEEIRALIETILKEFEKYDGPGSTETSEETGAPDCTRG